MADFAGLLQLLDASIVPNDHRTARVEAWKIRGKGSRLVHGADAGYSTRMTEQTALLLRRVQHPMAAENYRVILDGIEIGSIGVQVGVDGRTFWAWGIDTVVPVRQFRTHGEAVDRESATAKFRQAWDVFASEPERLRAFIEWKTAAADR
ncbi:hypothetical protein [Rhodopseudomonas telluris]|uniref:Uncharacterized protein n=1 Tax=Rhodopseudomonas telluris TaxID=644215 RepID=A0ABV6EZP1_9BRAD